MGLGTMALWCCLAAFVSTRADDPPRLEPTLDAAPNKAWAWTSGGGLRYTWVLPAGIGQGEQRDLVVICHPAEHDYRWGTEHFKPGEFRPRDFVVGVDGTSKGRGDTRLFVARDEDIAAFGAFLDEVRALLPVKRVFLYGHSQGAFFALYFAGEKPEMLEGMVAHAPGVWRWPRIDDFVLDVPFVLLHGTMDPAAPYSESVTSRDVAVEREHPLVVLRRLGGFGHEPVPAAASEGIDWCLGMRTRDATEAVRAGEAIAASRPRNGEGRACSPWFAGAYAVLRRFRGEGPRPFGEHETGGLEARAIESLRKIEAAALQHAEMLRADLPGREALTLDGRPWLGHLVCAREDFRGVGPMEALAADLGYDELAARHAEAAGEMTRTFYQQASDKRIFETAMKVLPSCFLVEGLPEELIRFIPLAFERAQELRISPDALKRYRNFVMWKAGWDEGVKRYEAMWTQWEPGPR